MNFVCISFELTKKHISVCLLSLLCLATIGCSSSGGDEPPTGSVAITITYDDQPVTEAAVQLMGIKDAHSVNGNVDSSGNVKFDKVRTGEYVVTASPLSAIPEGIDPTDPNYKPPAKKKHPNLPKKFRSLQTSTLKAVVKEGENNFSFDLTDVTTQR